MQNFVTSDKMNKATILFKLCLAQIKKGLLLPIHVPKNCKCDITEYGWDAVKLVFSFCLWKHNLLHKLSGKQCKRVLRFLEFAYIFSNFISRNIFP